MSLIQWFYWAVVATVALGLLAGVGYLVCRSTYHDLVAQVSAWTFGVAAALAACMVVVVIILALTLLGVSIYSGGVT